MKKQINQRIQNCKNRIEGLEKVWDKLDSQGLATEQQIVTSEMEELRKEIIELELLLKEFDN